MKPLRMPVAVCMIALVSCVPNPILSSSSEDSSMDVSSTLSSQAGDDSSSSTWIPTSFIDSSSNPPYSSAKRDPGDLRYSDGVFLGSTFPQNYENMNPKVGDLYVWQVNETAAGAYVFVGEGWDDPGAFGNKDRYEYFRLSDGWLQITGDDIHVFPPLISFFEEPGVAHELMLACLRTMFSYNGRFMETGVWQEGGEFASVAYFGEVSIPATYTYGMIGGADTPYRTWDRGVYTRNGKCYYVNNGNLKNVVGDAPIEWYDSRNYRNFFQTMRSSYPFFPFFFESLHDAALWEDGYYHTECVYENEIWHTRSHRQYRLRTENGRLVELLEDDYAIDDDGIESPDARCCMRFYDFGCVTDVPVPECILEYERAQVN